MDDRRKGVRLTFRTKVRILKNNAQKDFLSQGVIKNLSKRGFAFMSEDPLSRGLLYFFNIDLLGFSIRLVGKVVHMHELETYYVYGVRLDTMPLFDRIRFNQFLVGRDGGIKIRYFVFSLLLGSLMGYIAFALFGWSKALSLLVAFAVAILHFAFPPF